jgi:hypothetical protein
MPFDGVLPRPRQLIELPNSWKRWATAGMAVRLASTALPEWVSDPTS